MGRKAVVVPVLILLLPAISWAGSMILTNAPAMGEAGMIMLGVGLVGAGMALLRRRKR